MPPAALPPLLAARYEVTGLLGRGAMGVVVAATERASGRPVAIKLSTGGTELAAARFEREGELLASLRHPGIVAVHDAGLVDGRQFLVMELVRGARPLDQALAGAPLRRKVEALRDVARAVGHAHARGIVHRDLKPANILVDEEGAVRVSDFGVATAEERERLTLTGVMIGTPVYMSPEQLLGLRAQIGKATDVWALGVTLHELLSGERPFESDSLFGLMAQVLEQDPPPLRDAPPELEAVVRAALARESAQRLPDGDALADELDRWLRGERPRSGITAAPRLRRRVRRALVACLLISGAAMAAAPGLRGARAAALLDEAQEWDGAACARGGRTCAGGPHRLARWGLGAGDPAAAPTLEEVEGQAERLEAIGARLGSDPRAAEAADLAARYRAHVRLLGGASAGSATPTEQVVTLIVALRDPAPLDPAAVASATALVGGEGAPPGAAEALDAAWLGRLQADLPTPTGSLAAVLDARGAAASPELLAEARGWAAGRWLPALALALREPGAIRLAEARALCALAGARPTAAELEGLRAGLREGLPALVRDLADREGPALDDAVASLRPTHELVFPYEPGPYLEAALALEPPGRALRLHAHLTRGVALLRWRPTDRSLPPGQEELLASLAPDDGYPERVADALSSADPRDVAEGLVGQFRVSATRLRAALDARPRAQRRGGVVVVPPALLAAIAADRPWSVAARVTGANTEGITALERARALAAILELPASDLHEGFEAYLRRDVVLAALDALDAEGEGALSLAPVVRFTAQVLLETTDAAVGARALAVLELRRRGDPSALLASEPLREARYPRLAAMAVAHEFARRRTDREGLDWAEHAVRTAAALVDDAWERDAFRPYHAGVLARAALGRGQEREALAHLDGPRRTDALGVDVLEVVAPLLERLGERGRLKEWRTEQPADTPATRAALERLLPERGTRR